MKIKREGNEVFVVGCAWHERDRTNERAKKLGLPASHSICQKCKDKLLNIINK